MNDSLLHPDCPFCTADLSEIGFAESANFAAIYNIAPILPGHSLIVPKRHVESLMSLSDSELAELMIFGRDVAKLLLRVFETSGFNWTIQEKEEAGQTVPHLHMHLIPRTPGDLPRPGDWYPRLRESEAHIIDSHSRQRLRPVEMREAVARIRRIAQTKGA